MSVHGKVTNVMIHKTGDWLASAGAAGATQWSLYEVKDFDEDGGLLTVDDGATNVEYTGVDTDLGILFLAAPYATALDVDTEVLTYPLSEEKWALCAVDDDEDAIQALVPNSLMAQFEDGVRDEDFMETVDLVEIDEEWQISDLSGIIPLLDGALIDPDTLPEPTPPAASDGQVPGQVLNVGTVGGLGCIFLKWQAVTANAIGGTQVDRMSYDVYVSTDPAFVTPTPADKVGETGGTLATLKYMPDGTPFVYNNPIDGTQQTYQFIVVARDLDGSGVPSAPAGGAMNQAATGDFAANSVTADILEAVLVLGTTITTRSQVDGSSVGSGIEMTPDTLIAYDQSGRKVLEITPDAPAGSPGAVFRGDAEIDHLTVLTLTTLQESVLSQNAKMTLQSNIANPTAQGSVVASYVTQQWPDDGQWGNRFGFAVTPDRTKGFTMNVISGKWYLERWDIATRTMDYQSYRSPQSTSDVYIAALAMSGSEVYCLRHIDSETVDDWQVLRFDGTTIDTLPAVTVWKIGVNPAGAVDMSAKYCPTMGYDGTNVIFGWTQYGVGNLYFQKGVYPPPPSPANATAWPNVGGVIATSVDGYNNNGCQLLCGSFDFVSPRWVYLFRDQTQPNRGVQVLLPTGVNSPNDRWPTNGGVGNGIWWDPDGISAGVGQFKIIHHGIRYSYEGRGNNWTTESSIWWLSYNWTNSAASAVTKLSPPLQYTMPKRARLSFYTPSYPPGVTGAAIYLARAATKPDENAVNYTKQGDAALAGSTPGLTIANAAFTPLNNPIASTFAAGVPAELMSDTRDVVGALISLKGNGGWRLVPLGRHDPQSLSTVDKFDTGWQELATASGFTKSICQWRRIGNIAHLHARITNNSAIAYTATGSITDVALLAALPAEVRPSFDMPIPISNLGRPGMGYIAGSDGIYRLQTTDGYGTANNIAAGSNLIIYGTWFV